VDAVLVHVGRQAGSDDLLLGHGRRLAARPVGREVQNAGPLVADAVLVLEGAVLGGRQRAADDVAHHHVAGDGVGVEPGGETVLGEAVLREAVLGKAVLGEAVLREPVLGKPVRAHAVVAREPLLLRALYRCQRRAAAGGDPQRQRQADGSEVGLHTTSRCAASRAGHVEPLLEDADRRAGRRGLSSGRHGREMSQHGSCRSPDVQSHEITRFDFRKSGVAENPGSSLSVRETPAMWPMYRVHGPAHDRRGRCCGNRCGVRGCRCGTLRSRT
jgi:hypothetical protein